jgi:hypothetical protein
MLKLHDRVVLETSIRDAMGKFDAPFGYAEGFDPTPGEYAGSTRRPLEKPLPSAASTPTRAKLSREEPDTGRIQQNRRRRLLPPWGIARKGGVGFPAQKIIRHYRNLGRLCARDEALAFCRLCWDIYATFASRQP